MVRSAQQSEILIYAIGLLTSETARSAAVAKHDLDTATLATGGEAFYPKELSEVDDIAEHVARDLRNQYTIAYNPTDQRQDATFPPHQSNSDVPGAVVKTRTGYFADPLPAGSPRVAVGLGSSQRMSELEVPGPSNPDPRRNGSACPVKGLVATIELLDEGGTVPFIARYRKEATGNLDEVQIRAIEEKLTYFRELEDRRELILRTIEEQGKLTPELRARIEAALDKSELEDLYLPYKPKRRTKATIARDKGLEPLALYIWEQKPAAVSLLEFAATFVDAAKGVATVEEALEGARHIVAEMISENADFRKALRKMMFDDGVIVSRKIEPRAGEPEKDEQGKFRMYYDYREPVSQIPSHRMLAIRRGENENVLYFAIELEPERPLAYLKSQVLKQPGDWTAQLELAIQDCWKRLLNLSIQSEIRLELKQQADTEAIKVFRENLANLLLAPPAGQMGVLAIDPGIRTGCKIAVVDETGKFLEHSVIYPHQPKNDHTGSGRILKELIAKHNVRAIAIGNGTASRETEAFVRDFLSKESLTSIFGGQRE